MQHLASVGLCLVVLALVLRGGASALRRPIARARQHGRATGEAGDSAKLANQERQLTRAALAALVLGVILTAIGLIWR